MNKESLEKYKNENGDFKDNITELIDKWVSESLDTGCTPLNDLVKEVNVHHHTKSCKKGTSTCRFSFPRLPSDKTLIAYPIPELSSKEESANFKKILNAVRLKKSESDKDLKLYEQDLEEFLRNLSINIVDYNEAMRWDGIKKRADKSKKILEKVRQKLIDLTDEELEKYDNNLTDFLKKELSIDIKEYHDA